MEVQINVDVTITKMIAMAEICLTDYIEILCDTSGHLVDSDSFKLLHHGTQYGRHLENRFLTSV